MFCLVLCIRACLLCTSSDRPVAPPWKLPETKYLQGYMIDGRPGRPTNPRRKAARLQHVTKNTWTHVTAKEALRTRSGATLNYTTTKAAWVYSSVPLASVSSDSRCPSSDRLSSLTRCPSSDRLSSLPWCPSSDSLPNVRARTGCGRPPTAPTRQSKEGTNDQFFRSPDVKQPLCEVRTSSGEFDIDEAVAITSRVAARSGQEWSNRALAIRKEAFSLNDQLVQTRYGPRHSFAAFPRGE